MTGRDLRGDRRFELVADAMRDPEHPLWGWANFSETAKEATGQIAVAPSRVCALIAYLDSTECMANGNEIEADVERYERGEVSR